MESKTLLIGIVSFISGALLVSIAATTFDKPEPSQESMSSMVEALKDKIGDEYDKEFISQMIVHHEGAIEMAKLSSDRAKHDEIKKLSEDILSAQSKEIDIMKNWQRQWNYKTSPQVHHSQ